MQVDSYGRIVLISNQTPVTSLTANSGQVTVSAAAGALTFGLASYSTPTTGSSNGYYIPVVQTDLYGRTAITGNVAIPTGTTSVTGLLQLTTGVSSTSTTTAATPAAVKLAYDNSFSAYAKANDAGQVATAGFIHANASFSKANNAGDIAAAAFTQANTALSTGFFANTAWDVANAAFIQANAAFAQANTVGVQSLTANSGQVTANTSTGNIVFGLATTAVSAGTYGAADKIPVITIDEFGRATYAANVSVTIPSGTNIYANATQLTANASTGNVLIGLANVNSSIGTYGGTSAIPVITFDGFGRALSVSNVGISIPSGTNIYANSGQLTANSSSGNVLIGLAASGATIGTYGSTTKAPVITVDTYGRITSVSEATISGGGGGGAVGITSAAVGIRERYVALEGQTLFPTGDYTVGYVDVYVNGVHLSATEFLAVSGSSVTITGLTLRAGDIIDIIGATLVSAASPFFRESANPTAGQTLFTLTNTYLPGYLDVHVNGIRLVAGVDYVATNGTSVTINAPTLVVGDIVEFTGPSTYILNQRSQTTDTFTATTGQTTFTTSVGYSIGHVQVFVNGFFINPSEYTATDGSTVVLSGFTLLGGEQVTITSGLTFPLANAVSTFGGTITGNLTLTGNLIVNQITANANIVATTANLTSIGVTTANITNITINTTANIALANITTARLVTANATTINTSNAIATTANITSANVTTLSFADGSQQTKAGATTGKAIAMAIVFGG